MIFQCLYLFFSFDSFTFFLFHSFKFFSDNINIVGHILFWNWVWLCRFSEHEEYFWIINVFKKVCLNWFLAFSIIKFVSDILLDHFTYLLPWSLSFFKEILLILLFFVFFFLNFIVLTLSFYWRDLSCAALNILLACWLFFKWNIFIHRNMF